MKSATTGAGGEEDGTRKAGNKEVEIKLDKE